LAEVMKQLVLRKSKVMPYHQFWTTKLKGDGASFTLTMEPHMVH